MDIKELNDNIEIFIKDKISYIQNYLNNNIYNNDDFFLMYLYLMVRII